MPGAHQQHKPLLSSHPNPAEACDSVPQPAHACTHVDMANASGSAAQYLNCKDPPKAVTGSGEMLLRQDRFLKLALCCFAAASSDLLTHGYFRYTQQQASQHAHHKVFAGDPASGDRCACVDSPRGS